MAEISVLFCGELNLKNQWVQWKRGVWILMPKFSKDETYTGTLVYSGETYRFVFSHEELKLLPNVEDKNPLNWLFDLKKLPDGSYTWKTPPRIEEELLVGNCYETSNKIFFAKEELVYFADKTHFCS